MPPRLRWRPSAALVIALVWTIYGVAGLRHHGLTSDEPSLLYSGDRTLFALLHPGVKPALDLEGPEPPGFSTPFARFPDRNDPMHYPVMPGFIAAVTSSIFHDALGWLDVIDGHHLGLVLLQAVGLMLYCRWSTRLLGRTAGVAATIALALYPSGLGHAFNNAKDWPCAVFSGVAILAAGVGFVENRGRPLISAGVFFGLALSCKLNGVFGLAALALWTPCASLLLYWRRPERRPSMGMVGGALLIPYIATGLFFVLWPWLYQGHGLASAWRHLDGYMSFMFSLGTNDRHTWTAYPWRVIFFMTPPLLLVAAAIGIALSCARPRARPEAFSATLLLVVSGALPVVRIAAPGANFYDANRHFIEYVPALCGLAGVGVGELWRWLPRVSARLGPATARRLGRPWAPWVLGAVAVGTLVWPILEYRPFEATYFNVFTGGLGGAQRAGLFRMPPPTDPRVNGTEGDYWWSSLRDGVRAARAADPRAPFAMCGAGEELLPPPRAGKAETPPLRITQREDPTALVYVCPRECFCPWATVRDLESARPILKRVERGGGLVWELLGPATGARHEAVSPENPYTRGS